MKKNLNLCRAFLRIENMFYFQHNATLEKEQVFESTLVPVFPIFPPPHEEMERTNKRQKNRLCLQLGMDRWWD